MPDPLTTAALITAGASLLGSGGTAVASAKQAQKNRDFQERMSSTAYQRSAKDLKAAGLNRILALGNPATTPGGAMGQVPDFGQSMAAGAAAGVGVMSGSQDIAQSKAMEKKILKETENLSEIQRKLIAQSDLWEEIAPIIVKGAGDFGDLSAMLNEIAPKILTAIKDMDYGLANAWQLFMDHWTLSSGFIPNPFSE